ncbi:MAG TPA: membrane protein insertion efficiency factor YidD [Vicinamibacterales bacterium]
MTSVRVSVLRGRAFLFCGVALLVACFAIGTNAQPLALGSIHAYQRLLSPFADRVGARCRFTPTCSRYAEVVIARDGVMRGGWKALGRIVRCNPFTPMGTRDEP